jgi:hypothetical protein
MQKHFFFYNLVVSLFSVAAVRRVLITFLHLQFFDQKTPFWILATASAGPQSAAHTLQDRMSFAVVTDVNGRLANQNLR